MMPIRFQTRLTIVIVAMVVLTIAALSAVLVDRFHRVVDATSETTEQVISESLTSQFRDYAGSLAELIAEGLAGPIYQFEFDDITKLAMAARANNDVSYLYVFDAQGRIIHDGTSDLATLGQKLSGETVSQTLNGREPQYWIEDDKLVVEAPVVLGTIVMGGVRIAISIASVATKVEQATIRNSEIMDASFAGTIATTILITIGLALLGAVIAILAARRLTRPILALAGVAKDIGEGRYDTAVSLSRSDEIGELADAMRRMAMEREEAERALRLGEVRFRDFANAAADRFWETDRDHRYSFLSEISDTSELPTAENLLGRTRWDVAGFSVAEEPWAGHLKDLEAHRPFRDFRYSVPNEDGHMVYVRVSGAPVHDEDGEFIGYRGTVVSETAVVEARQYADLIRKQFFEAMDILAHGFILWDADDRFVTCNTQYFELYPETKPILEPGLHFDDYMEQVGASLAGKIVGGTKDWGRGIGENYHSLTPTQEIIYGDKWVQIQRHRLRDGSKVAFHFDITALKQQEEQLRQAQKMEAVGQLTGGVAHDFNNLLGGIMGNLELIGYRIKDDGELQARIERAINLVRRGANLTNRLIAFSRKQDLAPTALDIRALIDEMLEIFQRTLGENVAIEVEAPEQPWFAFADYNQVETALLNLTINASQAMPDGGTLAIKCWNTQFDSRDAHLNDVAIGEYIAIAVSDSGGGIPADAMEHVFEPFFTTKEVGQGSGLGLSMVYGFIKQSGGHVEISSELNHGTTVTMYLPRATGELPIITALSGVVAPPAGNGEHVLLVEDDIAVHEVASSMLSSLGYSVINGGDGGALDDVLRDCPEPHALLCDMVLPAGRSGDEVVSQVRARYPDIRVIMMTGYAHGANGQHNHHDAGHLNKPFKMEDLASAVAIAMAGRTSSTSTPGAE